MKKILQLWVTLVLVVYLFMPKIEAEETPKTIVVIHAYHLGYTWTYNNNEGLRETILDRYPNANIYTEFLDWKRFPSEDILNHKVAEFRDKYKDLKVDLLLTTDDLGLIFALDHREELFDNAPIAFSGIIPHTAAEIIGDEQDVTGVYETMRPEGAFELMAQLQTDITDIVYIHDLSESGLRTAEAFDLAVVTLGLQDVYVFHDWEDKSYEMILEEIKALDPHTAVMYFSYSHSSDDVVKSTEAFCQEVSTASSVPMYSNDEAIFGHGITGGTFLSGVLQGNQLGHLGIQILEGTDPDSIPHVTKATVYTGVDELQLIRFGLNKDLLPEDTLILNEQFSFYETYRELVLITSGIIVGLLVFILILLNIQRALRISRKEVFGQQIELQALYEQIQASEEELRAQNDALEAYQVHLEYEAHHDHLTKLSNRFALDQYMNNFLLDVQANHKKAIIVFIDLDNFKFVNNTYGHHFGDQVLVLIANRLTTIDDSIYIARIGGDEFIASISYEEADEAKVIDFLLLRINQLISQPLTIEKEHILVKASIGYSIYPEDGDSYDQLIIEADTAMYQAKKEGKASIKRYHKSMSNVYQNEYVMTNNLKEAYVNKEFSMMFQPIMSADGHFVESFEALVRWHSLLHGLVPPNVFIPMAETSGLIIPIGYTIIDQALKFASNLCYEGYKRVKVSINISVVQFYDEEFVELFLLKIKSAGLEPSSIQIEITESVMIETYHMLTYKLAYLREKGITVALDDFGTGYSSLAYLHELPIDVLKIDKVFVDDIKDDHTKTPLVDAAITLAKNFGLQVVAEGVEERHQLKYLQNAECQYIQGYYFSKPLNVEDAMTFYSKYGRKD